ncbi:HET-domain-containing protein [Ophiobolus disseminans]|uniref:HET-domain-containing protein n=1 Tax=Ophiobolus disseminans TaxID=1469910 RepID=A0A6A6ZLD9_9PLEO|nr:HET-domain-containing protein [Ophiobolus disseminans]
MDMGNKPKNGVTTKEGGISNGAPVNVNGLTNSSGVDTQQSIPSLCTKCQGLDLNPNRFIVRSRAPRETMKPADFRLMSTTSPFNFGTYKEIADGGRGCSLCQLVLRSVQQETGTAVRYPIDTSPEADSAICYLSWEVDGREVFETQDDPRGPKEKHQSPRGLTRRIHLRWSNPLLKDSYLVFLASGKRMTASDAERAWNPTLLFLGREIGLRGNIQARVKSWIDLCQEKHRGPCLAPPRGIAGRFSEMLSHSYFGVIDVLNMQLTELPTRLDPQTLVVREAHYVALSYVWGETPAYRTVLENVMQHRMHGGLDRVIHELPKVIQDAIELVRRVGIQYLWIDALCIIQNSARSWKLNAYNMDLIYGNAIFTICAADGPSASTGLLAMHENTGTGTKDQLIADCTEDVRLVVSRPPEMYIQYSRWNTRAWTFQERLLSRRCLIFTGSRVYFQCHSTGMSEDIYADREGAGWSLDFMHAPLQTIRQLPLRSIWVYMKSVELYTARELSDQADILAAFSGVSNLMQQTMQAPFVFGLPMSHLDLSLLWDHVQPTQRRKHKGSAADGEYTDFPSWSWSGWVGAAAHYRRDMIEDCLDNVNEWLEERTWVRWYIRDGNGDLRPLWNQDQWQMDLSEHENWRGYGNDRSSGSMLFWTKTRGRRSTIVTRNSTWPPRDRNNVRTGPVSRPYTPVRRDNRRHLASEDDESTSDEESKWSLIDAPPPAQTLNKTRGATVEQPEIPLDSLRQSRLLPSQVAQSSSIGQRTLSTLPLLYHTLERWASIIYRNEIVRFLVNVSAAVLRLFVVMLGMPVPQTANDYQSRQMPLLPPVQPPVPPPVLPPVPPPQEPLPSHLDPIKAYASMHRSRTNQPPSSDGTDPEARRNTLLPPPGRRVKYVRYEDSARSIGPDLQQRSMRGENRQLHDLTSA